MSSALIRDFEFVKGTMSTSASHTDFWIIRNRQNKKRYMLKLFVNQIKGEHTRVFERQNHEVRTYAALKTYLIEQEQVRNILYYYGYGSEIFRNLVEFVYRSRETRLTKKEIEHNLIQITRFIIGPKAIRTTRIDDKPVGPLEKKEHFYNPKAMVYSYIITEYVEGREDFADLLRKTSILNAQIISRYMAIILTTLYQMSQLGINQNDLHFGNIFINRTSYGPDEYFQRVYLLVFANKTVIVDNPYTPLIYDFDRASIYNRKLSFLEGYKHGGNCPEYHEKRDFIRALCCLYKYMQRRPEYSVRLFSEKMMETLFIDDAARSFIRGYEGSSCHLSISEKDSVQCLKKIQEFIIDLPEILAFFFEHAKFETVSTRALYKNEKPAVQTIIRRLNEWGLKNVRSEEKQYLYLVRNIQFISKCSKEMKTTITNNLFTALHQ
jgi:hypothetical protein